MDKAVTASFLVVITLVVGFFAIIAYCGTHPPETYIISGKVVNVEYSAGGYASVSITAVYLDNGSVIPLHGKHLIIIGDEYYFVFTVNDNNLVDWGKTR